LREPDTHAKDAGGELEEIARQWTEQVSSEILVMCEWPEDELKQIKSVKNRTKPAQREAWSVEKQSAYIARNQIENLYQKRRQAMMHIDEANRDFNKIAQRFRDSGKDMTALEKTRLEKNWIMAATVQRGRRMRGANRELWQRQTDLSEIDKSFHSHLLLLDAINQSFDARSNVLIGAKVEVHVCTQMDLQRPCPLRLVEHPWLHHTRQHVLSSDDICCG